MNNETLVRAAYVHAVGSGADVVNVLLLSVSAKISLVRAFREVLARYKGRVLGADLDPRRPALRYCDELVKLPKSASPDFGPALVEAVRKRDIGLVVPTRDGELAALSSIAEALDEAGALAVVAAREALEICRDKLRFVSLCADLGLETPPTYCDNPPAHDGPLFVRPRFGAGSKGARAYSCAGHLEAEIGADEFIIQDLVDLPEYSVDVLLDLAGRGLQAVSRRRLVVRNGESAETRVEMDDRLCEEGLQIAEAIGLVGPAVLQAFHSPDSGTYWIEANARFGGASILSIKAGLDSPRRLIQMATGEMAEATKKRAIQDGLFLRRNGEDTFTLPRTRQ